MPQTCSWRSSTDNRLLQKLRSTNGGETLLLGYVIFFYKYNAFSFMKNIGIIFPYLNDLQSILMCKNLSYLDMIRTMKRHHEHDIKMILDSQREEIEVRSMHSYVSLNY